MSNQKRIIKGFRFFDTFYMDSVPVDLISDWGHKEKVKEIYIIVDENEYIDIVESDSCDLNEYFQFDDEKQAIEELAEWNEIFNEEIKKN